MKILEIVTINGHPGYVVDEAAPLIYHEELVYDKTLKRTERMLIGESTDGRMDFLTYRNWGSMKAFAGRELHIQMEDGTERTIKDVWWSEGSIAWSAAHVVELRGFSYNTLAGMIDCCVFYGGIIREDRLQELVNEFYAAHPDYSPWDYNAWRDHCHALHADATLPRVNKVLESIAECGSVIINDERFSTKHPLGATVLAELERYKRQLPEGR